MATATNYPGTSTTVSFEQPDAAARRRGFLDSAFSFANAPTPVPVRQVAGLDPYEMQARTLSGGLGGFSPYISQGSQMMQGGYGTQQQGRGMYGRGADASNLGINMFGRAANLADQGAGMYAPGAAQQFYDPYEDSVVQQTLADLKEAGIGTGISDRASQIGQGAFGGSRGRLMEGERARQMARGAAESVGQIRSRGFEGARAAAQNAGQGLGQLGSQAGNYAQGIGQIGGQFGQFGQGLGSLGSQMGTMGQNFAGLGMTGQEGLMNQITGFGNMGAKGREIQDRMYGAQFDAATGLANEPGNRMAAYQGMLGLLPTTTSTTRYGQTPSGFDLMDAINKLLGTSVGYTPPPTGTA